MKRALGRVRLGLDVNVNIITAEAETMTCAERERNGPKEIYHLPPPSVSLMSALISHPLEFTIADQGRRLVSF